jgi:hypothetical protein
MSHDSASSDQSGQHFGQMGNDFASADIMGSDMENISWSTLFGGLKVNTGLRFFVVFTTFICWLYVVYWVRHHEPFVNQAIGISAPHSQTAAADRSIIARTIKVFTFQTSAIGASSFYTPTPAAGGLHPPLQVLPQQLNFSAAMQGKPHAAPGQAMSSPLIGPSEQAFDQRFGSPVRP